MSKKKVLTVMLTLLVAVCLLATSALAVAPDRFHYRSDDHPDDHPVDHPVDYSVDYSVDHPVRHTHPGQAGVR